ncbi:unnamed protein product [Owenia fusiformis]|uniref:Uncharacterized protein n=1 Tax=Owenia fusiformis TaxID=6347 RepID=A0A8J1U2R2_OWEFU|nr:unnamed protein product [Owenia fusiformis]
MAAVCYDEIPLMEYNNDEDIENDMPVDGAYELEVCVVENVKKPDHDDVNTVNEDDTAEIPVGDIVEIDLEEGKEYHLFFCHSSVDLAWVWDVVKVLEAPPYSLKCAFSDRDFMPGQNDMNEMFRCITGSMRTVFVLTPAFKDSRWCEWEMQMAQTASVANNISLLPIMLQECPVPDTIKHINYIDVTHGDVQQAAIKLQKNVEKPGQGFFPQNSALRINGSSFPITEVTVKKGCCRKKIRFELPQDGKDALEQKGITISEEEINELLQGLTLREASIQIDRPSGRFLLCIGFSHFMGFLWFLFWTVNAIWALICLSKNQDPNANMTLCSRQLTKTYTRKECNALYITVEILFFLLGCVPSTALFIYSTLRKRKLKKVVELIRDLSMVTMINHKMYICFARTEQYLRIVKYDINSCYQRMIQQCVNLDVELGWVQKVIQNIFPVYMEGLMQEKLDKAHIVVHPTINNQICFCQYIQAIQARHGLNNVVPKNDHPACPKSNQV